MQTGEKIRHIVLRTGGKINLMYGLSRRFRRRLRGRYHLLFPWCIKPQDRGVLLKRETFSSVNMRAGKEHTINFRIDLN